MKYLPFLAALVAAPASADIKIEIPFVAEIAGKPFDCSSSFAGLGSTGTTAQVADFRVYASNFRMIAEDGSEVPLTLTQDGIWQLDNAVLLDFENASDACANGTAEANTVVKATAPDGNYTGLLFDIGLPFAQNHGDATIAASPLNLTAMFWTWQFGYKFVKIDFSTAGLPLPPPMKTEGMDMSGAANGWSLHLGSTGCAADSQTSVPAAECANPNRVAVRLDDFMPGMAGMDTVVLDPAPVLAGTNMDVNAPDTAPGCMSFPGDADCADVMRNLGLPFDGAAAGTQVFATLR